jgi:hypothetical protein
MQMDERSRLGDLILYVARKSETDLRFGATKLNKILYYVDFSAYRLLGRSISGDEYQHLPNGPAPKHLLPVLQELESQGAVARENRQAGPFTQTRVVVRRPVRDSAFTDAERQIVDDVVEVLRPMSAAEVTDVSHKEFGYRTTEDREVIPYYTAWIGSEPLTDEQIQLGQEIAQRHGYLAAVNVGGR